MDVFKAKEISIEKLFNGAQLPTELAKKPLTLNSKLYCKERWQYLSKKHCNNVGVSYNINYSIG